MNLLLPLLLTLSMGPGQAPAAQTIPQSRGSALQTPPEAPGVPPPPATYTIGPQDALRIAVADEAEIGDKVYTVETDGSISFWILGRVAVGGLTLRQVHDKLTAALADGFIRNPVVRVEMDKYKSQYVQVLGEVRTPGRIAMSGSKTLLEAIADAGSMTGNASNEVDVTHTRRPDGTPLGSNDGKDKVTINLDDVLAAQAFVLRDGDVITVPKAQTFFIGGEVRNNTSLVWRRNLTLIQAVTLAGGLTERGTLRGASATRILKDKTISVKLKEQDKVLPDDVIKVGRKLF